MAPVRNPKNLFGDFLRRLATSNKFDIIETTGFSSTRFGNCICAKVRAMMKKEWIVIN